MIDRPEYHVESLPAPIKAKITEYHAAVRDHTQALNSRWKGEISADAFTDVGNSLGVARYNLERTIKTYLDKAFRAEPPVPKRKRR